MSNGSLYHPRIPVGVRGLGHWVPPKQLSNEDLAGLGVPVTPEWIEQKTGIRFRYVAESEEAMSDLARPAAWAALGAAGLTPADVDAIVVAGDLHDSGGVQLTSALVAQGIGRTGLACFDLRVGCPASVMALHFGLALVASGLALRTLVVAAEVNSRTLAFTDRTSVWFGDGAGAAVLEPCAPGTGVLISFVAGTGEGSDILVVPAGGSREPMTHEALERGRHRLQMDGKAVFAFAVERMVESLQRVTTALGITVHELDWIVPHQANLRIVEAAMCQLGLPLERAYLNLDRVGNTAGASVLLALSEAYQLGVIRPGNLVATVGFGGGLAWGAQVLCVNGPSDFAVEQGGDFYDPSPA